MSAIETLYRLKHNPLVRVASWPFINVLKRGRNLVYPLTADSKALAAMKNRHRGERCFLIGNGPSLTLEDLEALEQQGEITFASNRIYHIYPQTTWRPDYYVAAEQEFVKADIGVIDRVDAKRDRFVNRVGKRRSAQRAHTRWFNCYRRFTLQKHTLEHHFSPDASRLVYDGYTVTYVAIQLAVYLGFREIVLLGCDHNYRHRVDQRNRSSTAEQVKEEHFYRAKKNEYSTHTFAEGQEAAFRCARRYAEAHGIRIRNATRGGCLEVFERVNLDELLK